MTNLYDTIGIIKNGNKTKLPVIIVENIDADGVAYDNTSSGLSASDVQGAIDEVTTVETYSFTPTADVSNPTVNVRKVGRLVNLSCILTIATSSSGVNIDLGNVSDEAKPLDNQYVVIEPAGGALGISVSLGTNGHIYAFSSGNAQNWILNFSMTYISKT